MTMAVWFIFDPKEFVKFEDKIEDISIVLLYVNIYLKHKYWIFIKNVRILFDCQKMKM